MPVVGACKPVGLRGVETGISSQCQGVAGKQEAQTFECPLRAESRTTSSVFAIHPFDIAGNLIFDRLVSLRLGRGYFCPHVLLKLPRHRGGSSKWHPGPASLRMHLVH
jgi:hypothetical protein